MKSLIKITLLSSAIALALVGCDDKKDNTTTTPTTNQATTNGTDTQAGKAEFTPEQEAYAVGSSYGDSLRKAFEQNKFTLDQAQIIKGVTDGLNGKSNLSEEDTRKILYDLNQRLQKEAEERFETEKTENTKVGEEFRKTFAEQEGVKQTESGLLYQVMDEGSDQHPTTDDTVIVHYRGTLTDGTQFDSSYDRGEPTKFPLNGVIEGWQEGIQLVGVGGKIKLVIPPELAYGERGQSNIPPQSTLVFEVELLGIDDGNTNDEPTDESSAVETEVVE